MAKLITELTDEELREQIQSLEATIAEGDPVTLSMFCLQEYLSLLLKELQKKAQS